MTLSVKDSLTLSQNILRQNAISEKDSIARSALHFAVDQLEQFKNAAVCKGSPELSNNCGKCINCMQSNITKPRRGQYDNPTTLLREFWKNGEKRGVFPYESIGDGNEVKFIPEHIREAHPLHNTKWVDCQYIGDLGARRR